MIISVTVSNFKIFGVTTTIKLFDPAIDNYFVSVIVGRNGSGKSCLLEAIEWCLCNNCPSEMRSGNIRDMVNVNSRDGNMFVSVELLGKIARYIDNAC